MRRGLILALVFLSLINFVSATDCAVRTSCLANEINVLDVSSLTNAHVSSNNINYMQLCCPNSQISSSTVSATCSQTNPLKLYSLDNTHVEVPVATGYVSTGIYNYKLCVDSGLTCQVSQLSCSALGANYFCLLKFKENAGMTNTNAHVADCSDTFYSKSICCSSSGTCGYPGSECLGSGASTCCQPIGTNPTYPESQYCSYGPYDEQQAGEQGYCCPTGQYWDSEVLQCALAYVCNPTPCAYDINNDPYNYFTSNNCIRNAGQYWEACCSSSMYGQQNYYYCRVNVVNVV